MSCNEPRESRLASLPALSAKPFSARAQASLETLLIFILFLSLAAIAYFATSKTGAAAQERISIELSSSSFSDFSGKLSSACAMGSGNIRAAVVRGPLATIKSEEGKYSFSAGKFSAAENSSCEIIVKKEAASGSFTIANVDGKIEIS